MPKGRQGVPAEKVRHHRSSTHDSCRPDSQLTYSRYPLYQEEQDCASPKGTACCQAPQSPWAHQGTGLNVPEKAVGRTGWAEAQVPFLLVQRPVPQFCEENWSCPPVTSRLPCHSWSFLIPTPGHWVSTPLSSIISGQRFPLLILTLPSLPPSPLPLT